MNRFELLNLLQSTIQDQLVVCNIGLPSQELYKINDRPNYFYMLGSMGLASSIGLGLSLAVDKNVISIDGDGSVLMNMNTLATIGNRAPSNYTLLIVDNGSYGSTGDQKTFTNERTSLRDVAICLALFTVFVVFQVIVVHLLVTLFLGSILFNFRTGGRNVVSRICMT